MWKLIIDNCQQALRSGGFGARNCFIIIAIEPAQTAC
jgi:hypothetical protein